MIVADTDVLIDFLSGKGEAPAVERLLRNGTLRTTVITRFELLSGAKSGRELTRVRTLLAAISSLVLEDDAADAASEIRKLLESTGHTIGMADSLIAGIVTQQDAALLTRNRRHFERVPGLRLA
jgi:tRNA(fMet)-specific endonuclease VapC